MDRKTETAASARMRTRLLLVAAFGLFAVAASAQPARADAGSSAKASWTASMTDVTGKILVRLGGTAFDDERRPPPPPPPPPPA